MSESYVTGLSACCGFHRAHWRSENHPVRLSACLFFFSLCLVFSFVSPIPPLGRLFRQSSSHSRFRRSFRSFRAARLSRSSLDSSHPNFDQHACPSRKTFVASRSCPDPGQRVSADLEHVGIYYGFAPHAIWLFPRYASISL